MPRKNKKKRDKRRKNNLALELYDPYKKAQKKEEVFYLIKDGPQMIHDMPPDRQLQEIIRIYKKTFTKSGLSATEKIVWEAYEKEEAKEEYREYLKKHKKQLEIEELKQARDSLAIT